MTTHHGLDVTVTRPEWLSPELQAWVDSQGVRLVSIDTETTGLEAHAGSVTEVGWFDIGAGVGGQFIPPHSIEGADPRALEVSRYAERIAGQPQDANQVTALFGLLGGDGIPTVLVGSNTSFDQRQLAALFAAMGLPGEPWERRAIDVGQGAFWSGIGSLGAMPGLAAACDALDIDNSNHHAALDDALVAAQVFQALTMRASSATQSPQGS